MQTLYSVYLWTIYSPLTEESFEGKLCSETQIFEMLELEFKILYIIFANTIANIRLACKKGYTNIANKRIWS